MRQAYIVDALRTPTGRRKGGPRTCMRRTSAASC